MVLGSEKILQQGKERVAKTEKLVHMGCLSVYELLTKTRRISCRE